MYAYFFYLKKLFFINTYIISLIDKKNMRRDTRKFAYQLIFLIWYYDTTNILLTYTNTTGKLKSRYC